MKIYAHLDNADTAYASVRLNRDEMLALRAFMHTEPFHQQVGFPRSVRLFYRSNGWYRLDALNNHNIIEKLKIAIAIMRRFHKEYTEAVDNEIRKLLIQAQHNMQTVAYTTDDTTEEGVLHVKDTNDNTIRTLDQRVSASPTKLQQLAALFSR